MRQVRVTHKENKYFVTVDNRTVEADFYVVRRIANMANNTHTVPFEDRVEIFYTTNPLSFDWIKSRILNLS